ncbi:MAG: hypothetical protein J7L53_09370 [Deltaproteobacteria bacterium]|nr:hypothetical protein [Deltaproteobacteria bacterium]
MEKKHRILFATPGFYGHVAVALPIAKHLIADGHTVGWCSGSNMKDLVAKHGIQDFYPRDTYNAGMDKITEAKGIYDYMRKMPRVFTSDIIEQCLRELIVAFKFFKPDVVYIDSTDLLATAVADNLHIPFAHGSGTALFYFEKDIPPIGSGWDINKPRLNRLKLIPYLGRTVPFMLWSYLNNKRALKRIGVDWSIKSILRGVSPYLFMLFSTDKVEYPRKLFIPEIFYVGPSILVPDDKDLPDFPWERLDKNRPLIYVATGTLFFEWYKGFYKNVLKALSDDNFPIPVQVVMAIGKDQPIEQLGEIPPNCIVVQYAPQIKLLERTSILITHAGISTVNEALLQGIPMLAVPLGRDRMEMAQKIVYNGFGIRLNLNKATPRRIKQAILELLKNPRYARAAEGVMHSFRSCNAPRTGADLITRLADTGKPIRRKEGAPITLRNIKDLSGYIEEAL